MLNSLKSDKLKIKLPLNIFQTTHYNHMKELGFGCFAGKETICISPTGDVKVCSHMPKEFIAGNVKQAPILKIWQDSDKLKIFRNLKGNKKCLSCEKYNYCRSGCRRQALVTFGSLNAVDPFCLLNKVI
jgi:radical SAM protein with 4Fe4S-binding SPASM domain